MTVNKSTNDNKNESKEKNKRVIPLHKAYIWGIIFCLVCLIGMILYNNLHEPSKPIVTQIDYLALLRDSHERLLTLRGLDRIGDLTLKNFEMKVASKIGQTVIFPDWIGLLPSAKIIGARISNIGNDQSVSLLFTLDNHNINFITIYNSKEEITSLESVTLEEHTFYKYKWGNYHAYFWELTEDNAPITYGLISDLDPEELSMMATDTMRSLKNHYQRSLSE